MMSWKLTEDYLSRADKGLATEPSRVRMVLSKHKNSWTENYFEAEKATACLLEALNSW
jgi:hypothetical protein